MESSYEFMDIVKQQMDRNQANNRWNNRDRKIRIRLLINEAKSRNRPLLLVIARLSRQCEAATAVPLVLIQFTINGRMMTNRNMMRPGRENH